MCDEKRVIGLTVGYDTAPECPLEWDEWGLVSFDRKSIHYQSPRDVLRDEYGNMPIGLTRKLACNTAFALGRWGDDYCLSSSISERSAGILLWNGNPRHLPRDRRKEIARAVLEEYNQWARGEVYRVRLEEMHSGGGDFIFGCGGYYDLSAIARDLRDDPLRSSDMLLPMGKHADLSRRVWRLIDEA